VWQVLWQRCCLLGECWRGHRILVSQYAFTWQGSARPCSTSQNQQPHMHQVSHHALHEEAALRFCPARVVP
jgi:hypothetical protein